MFFPTLGLIATTDVVSVDIHATVQDAINTMYAHNHRSIVVINQCVHYIITSKDIITLKMSGLDFNTPLSQVNLKQMPIINRESNVINALNLTSEMNEYICVCNEDGSFYGLVTNSDIVASVDPQVILESLQLGSIFDKKYGFKSFEPDASINQIFEYMKDSANDCVLIQEGNTPLGILTSKDMLRLIAQENSEGVKASDVMSAPLETLTAKASISAALDFLKKRHYKRIVVVDDTGHIIGIVTQQDLISRTYLKWSQLVHEHFDQFKELTQVLQQKNKHLTELAMKDTLTGIHNRHMFIELFANESAMSKRYKTNLSLLMIDLDNFKQINDTFGHNIGDSVLKTFTSIVLEEIREVDVFARWGGEEFVLLLRHTNCAHAFGVAEKIRRAVEAYHFNEVQRMTCSIGVTDVSEEDTLEEAIARADTALYAAKHQGRNQTMAYAGYCQI
jgi:diguanylate cyclase